VDWTDQTERKQALAWLFAAGAAPALLACAGVGWQWALAAGALAALFFALLGLLAGEMPLGEAFLAAWGKGAGGVLLTLEGLWLLLAAGRAAAAGGEAFPEDPSRPLAAAALLLLAAWAASKGLRACARCGAVLCLLLAGSFAVLFAAAVPNMKWAWCRPWGSRRDGARCLAALLYPAAALFLQTRGTKKGGGWALLLLPLVPALAALVCSGGLSPELAAAERFPFYTLVKSLRLFSFLERFEPILSAAMLAGLFCLVCLFWQAAASLLGRLGGLGERKWFAPALLLPVAAASLLAPKLPVMAWVLGASIFWGFLPLAALLVVMLKIVRKKEKKGVDKRSGLC
jgi:hypothetical protein